MQNFITLGQPLLGEKYVTQTVRLYAGTDIQKHSSSLAVLAETSCVIGGNFKKRSRCFARIGVESRGNQD
jgi:hypothetical protein